MGSGEYEKALKKARAELAQARRDREQLDLRIARLMQTVAGLRSLVDPNFESDIGLTDAMRQVMEAAAKPLRPADIRAGLEAMGKSLADHSNPMASVHAILARLVKSEEVMELTYTEGKRYWWTLNGPPPADLFVQLPPESMSLSGLMKLAEQPSKKSPLPVMREVPKDKK